MTDYPNALSPGERIDGMQPDQYEILLVLGSGGFGITYKAFDHLLLNEVAIKEYLPSDIALRQTDGSSVTPKSSQKADEYQWGLERFLDEARTLSRFKHAPNIVRVESFLKANGTAYIVMDYEPGETLESYLNRVGTLDEDHLMAIMLPIMEGLRAIHAENFYHRDIKPANIYVRENGNPFLLDFGGARQALGEHSQSVTGIFTPGYTPVEQYSHRAKLTPASDLYALGATLYKCMIGMTPVESPERVNAEHEDRPDPLIPLSKKIKQGYRRELLETIDWMLQLKAKDRPRAVQMVLERLYPAKPEPRPIIAEEPV
ncbi:MAG: serine/threonine protein kinase, partial [Methylobacter sp.]